MRQATSAPWALLLAYEEYEMPEMNIMDLSGHSKIEWDPDDPESVENARKMFDDLLEKGYAAFRVKYVADKGENVKEFDPEAHELLMVPPMAGG